jgi:hypothetical protein
MKKIFQNSKKNNLMKIISTKKITLIALLLWCEDQESNLNKKNKIHENYKKKFIRYFKKKK